MFCERELQRGVEREEEVRAGDQQDDAARPSGSADASGDGAAIGAGACWSSASAVDVGHLTKPFDVLRCRSA